jgi:4-hydroxybenzoate polyprenyltransferase
MALQTRDSDSETGRHERPKTFREKHALKVMGVIMAAMFALVVAVQVAC